MTRRQTRRSFLAEWMTLTIAGGIIVTRLDPQDPATPATQIPATVGETPPATPSAAPATAPKPAAPISDSYTPGERRRLQILCGICIAQESYFGTAPSSRQPDANHDTGPYQQRALVGWYADGATVAENNRILQDMDYGTRTFLQGHEVPRAVKGGAGPKGYIIPGVFQKQWREGPLWEIVANVQVPARKYRILYDRWVPVVEALLDHLAGGPPRGTVKATDKDGRRHTLGVEVQENMQVIIDVVNSL